MASAADARRRRYAVALTIDEWAALNHAARRHAEHLARRCQAATFVDDDSAAFSAALKREAMTSFDAASILTLELWSEHRITLTRTTTTEGDTNAVHA